MLDCIFELLDLILICLN